MRSKACGALALLAMSVFSFPTLAAPGTVVVTFSGEAFDGPPEFVVRFGGTEIGRGAVDAAIDTVTQGRLADVARIEPYLETFEYAIPNGLFAPTAQVEIELTNDAFDPNTGFDRNLVVYSLLVNGRAVPTKDFKMALHGTDAPVQFFNARVALYSDDYTAIAAAPSVGWPALEQGVAEVPQAVAPDSTSGEVSADAAALEVVMPAQAPPGCEGRSVTVTNFGQGLFSVPDSQASSLDALVTGVPPGACRVVVTGYSSVGGSPEVNKTISGARAESVLAYLKKHGGTFSGEQIVAFGETDQFGVAAIDNQRVVVVLIP